MMLGKLLVISYQKVWCLKKKKDSSGIGIFAHVLHVNVKSVNENLTEEEIVHFIITLNNTKLFIIVSTEDETSHKYG